MNRKVTPWRCRSRMRPKRRFMAAPSTWGVGSPPGPRPPPQSTERARLMVDPAAVRGTGRPNRFAVPAALTAGGVGRARPAAGGGGTGVTARSPSLILNRLVLVSRCRADAGSEGSAEVVAPQRLVVA